MDTPVRPSETDDQANADRTLPRPGSHIPALDGIRGVAVLLVMGCHFIGMGSDLLQNTILGKLVHRAFDAGWSGVDLFFVLSGFLITGILYDAKDHPHYFRNYYIRRVLRIFPLYYGFLFVFFFLIPLLHPFTPAMEEVATRQEWLWAYGTNLIMAWERSWIFDVDWLRLGHFWTLAIEEQFYLLWPLLVLLLSRKALIRLCIACMLAALVIRISLVLHSADPILVGVFTFCRFDALAVGALTALLVRGHHADMFRPVRVGTALLGGAIAVLAIWRRGWDASDPFVQSLGFSLLGLFFAGILLLVIEPRRNNRLAHCFSNPVLMWFGTYSYALYVFHVPLMPVFERIIPPTSFSTILISPILGVIAFAVVAVLVTAIAAYLSWQLYEKHFLKLKRHFMLERGINVPDRTAVGISNSQLPVTSGGPATSDQRT